MRHILKWAIDRANSIVTKYVLCTLWVVMTSQAAWDTFHSKCCNRCGCNHSCAFVPIYICRLIHHVKWYYRRSWIGIEIDLWFERRATVSGFRCAKRILTKSMHLPHIIEIWWWFVQSTIMNKLTVDTVNHYADTKPIVYEAVCRFMLFYA